jgi:predicted transcriptional regulator
MITKKNVLDQIKSLPNEFTIDELIEKLIIVDKINLGLKDLEEGKILSEDEMDKEMQSWFK